MILLHTSIKKTEYNIESIEISTSAAFLNLQHRKMGKRRNDENSTTLCMRVAILCWTGKSVLFAVYVGRNVCIYKLY